MFLFLLTFSVLALASLGLGLGALRGRPRNAGCWGAANLAAGPLAGCEVCVTHNRDAWQNASD